MRIAVISDIHGNVEALQAVLRDISQNGADKIFCLGDIVGYGPHPRKCLELVQQCAERIVQGNHEAYVLDWMLDEENISPYALAGIDFTRKVLRGGELSFIGSLPLMQVASEVGVSLAHGSFSDPAAWEYIEQESEADAETIHFPTRLGLIGHTHLPFVFASINGLLDISEITLDLEKDRRYLINVGSVGQPRDGDPRACYGLLELGEDRDEFSLRRVGYDLERADKYFERAGLPAYSATRLFRGR